MKKLLLTLAALMGFGSVAFAGHFIDVLPPASASGCVPVSNGYDYNCTTDANAPIVLSSAPVMLWGRTISQLNAITPQYPGEIASCSNCVRGYVCVSSGTSTGAWVVAVETGTMGGSLPTHCQ